jgi:purine nucleosidase/pyrimidine-specific ribonucleoside hydrolase
MTNRVVIDTDPGIDDAIAILFALAHRGLEVAGITTVAGNVGLETTSRNALRILALAGHDVPVHAGAAAPLNRDRADAIRIQVETVSAGFPFPIPLPASPARMPSRSLPRRF